MMMVSIKTIRRTSNIGDLMPLILGTNSIKDTGYDVANSLRFDDGGSEYLRKNSK
jgi:hypothetical protein